MLNLNTFGDIALDYRFYEDPSDEFKVTDDSVEGSLLPLWSFRLEEIGKMEVTGMCWNKKYSDLLGNVQSSPVSSSHSHSPGVSYGSYNFYDQPDCGYICFYSLKNPSYPEYVLKSYCGVMCLASNPAHPQMVAAGLTDGNVAVYDLTKPATKPTFISQAGAGKHNEVVWYVVWADDNLDGYLNFYSCSSDGRVTNWTIMESCMLPTHVILLPFQSSLKTEVSPRPPSDLTLCAGPGEDDGQWCPVYRLQA